MRTLEQAKRDYQKVLKGDGGRCPCCKRWGKINGYQVTSTQVKGMIWMYKNFRKNEWIELGKAPKYILRSKALATLRHWDLVEKKPKEEKEDKRGSGFWRLTQKGRDFIRKKIVLPKYAFVFDSRLISYSTERVDVIQSLNKKFSYEELMKTTLRFNK